MQNRSSKIKRYPDVVKVKPVDDYILIADFSNGESKRFDCNYLLPTDYYKPLANKGIFNKAVADLGGIIWTDEIDIAKEEVYDRGVTISKK